MERLGGATQLSRQSLCSGIPFPALLTGCNRTLSQALVPWWPPLATMVKRYVVSFSQACAEGSARPAVPPRIDIAEKRGPAFAAGPFFVPGKSWCYNPLLARPRNPLRMASTRPVGE